MAPKLRYEIYVPTLYNDKIPIEPQKYRTIKNRLQNEFGGLSVHPATVQGYWLNPHDGRFISDNCYKYEIVVEKDPKNEKWFEDYKSELILFLNQHKIFMIFTEINWV